MDRIRDSIELDALFDLTAREYNPQLHHVSSLQSTCGESFGWIEVDVSSDKITITDS